MGGDQNNYNYSDNGKTQRLNDQERRIKDLEATTKSIYDLLLKVHYNIQGDSESGVTGLGNRVLDLETKTHRHDKWIYRHKIAYVIVGALISIGLSVLGIMFKSGVI